MNIITHTRKFLPSYPHLITNPLIYIACLPLDVVGRQINWSLSIFPLLSDTPTNLYPFPLPIQQRFRRMDRLRQSLLGHLQRLRGLPLQLRHGTRLAKQQQHANSSRARSRGLGHPVGAQAAAPRARELRTGLQHAEGLPSVEPIRRGGVAGPGADPRPAARKRHPRPDRLGRGPVRLQQQQLRRRARRGPHHVRPHGHPLRGADGAGRFVRGDLAQCREAVRHES